MQQFLSRTGSGGFEVSERSGSGRGRAIANAPAADAAGDVMTVSSTADETPLDSLTLMSGAGPAASTPSL